MTKAKFILWALWMIVLAFEIAGTFIVRKAMYDAVDGQVELMTSRMKLERRNLYDR